MRKEITYTVRSVKRRGKKDGRDWRWEPMFPLRKTKEPDPPLDQEEPTEFEEELLKASSENLKRVAQKWADIDEKLSKTCLNEEDRFKAAKSGDAKEGKEHSDAMKEYETAKTDFFNLPLPHIFKTLFLVLFALITGGEVLFNALVFSVFGQSRTDTSIMAIGVMTTILWLSDFLGYRLRVVNKSKTTIMLMVVSAALLLAGMLVIAVLREKFFEANKVVEALGIQWDTSSITLSFFIVNILLLIGMVVLGYEAGHKDPGKYKQMKRKFQETKKKLLKESAEAVKAADTLADARIAFNKAHAERTSRFEKVKYRAEEERDIWIRLAQTYRAANMAVRRVKTKPKSFNSDLDRMIVIPESLITLACKNCRYEEMRK